MHRFEILTQASGMLVKYRRGMGSSSSSIRDPTKWWGLYSWLDTASGAAAPVVPAGTPLEAGTDIVKTAQLAQ